jgi:hypothetical protein
VGGSAGGAGGGEESGAVSEIRQAHLSARAEGGGAPVVLPAERRGGRTTGWSVTLTHFLGVDIMKYIFTPYLFNVINIHIIHYKLSQTSNSLTGKSQSGHSLRDGGSTLQCVLYYCTPSVPKYKHLLTFSDNV